MVKFCKRILGFVFLIVILYAPIYCILVRYQLVRPLPLVEKDVLITEVKFSEHLREYEFSDILFIGSSNAYRSFDTRRFQQNGYRTFNMGTSSQTPVQTFFLLQQYLDTIHPKIVVISVTPSVMSIPPTESSLDFILSNFPRNKFQWEIMKLRMVFRCKSWYMFNTWIYNAFYHHILPNQSNMCEESFLFNDEMNIGDDKYIRGGYVEKMGEIRCGPTEFKPTNININPMQYAYFKKCIKLLNSKNIPFLLVETPHQPSDYINRQNQSEWEQLFAEYPYINYNERILLNDTLDFYDAAHMNKYGVAKFDSLFINEIDEIFEKAYSSQTLER